jgi:predicted metal-dependent phosphoesterase TrpH
MIDLHIHTSASSDGQHTPREIFEMAKKIGLEAIAFSDHNTVAALDEGFELSQEFGIEFIPAIEINTIYNELDLHLLAYYIDYREPKFKAWLDEINQEKVEQGFKRFEKLRELGFVLDIEDIEKISKGRIPSGATFLKAILSRKENTGNPALKPYIDGERSDSPFLNFYLDYLRGGKPAYVSLAVCNTLDSIKKVKSFSGVPVLAHPSDTPPDVVRLLIKEGLSGLEVYSSRHTDEEIRYYLEVVKRHQILYTAGSDFHGKEIKPNVELACIKGNGYEVLQRLKFYIQNLSHRRRDVE